MLISLLWPLINFTIFVTVGIFLYRKYVAPLLHVRSVQTEEDLKKASSLLTQALNELSLAKEKLMNMEMEKEQILSQYQQEGERLAEIILKQSIKMADKIIFDVGRQVEHDMNQTRKEVRRQILLLATKKVKEKLEKGVPSSIDRNLQDEVFRHLARASVGK